MTKNILENKLWRMVSASLLILLCGCGIRSGNTTIEAEGRLLTDMVISGKTMEDRLCLIADNISYYLAIEPGCEFIGADRQEDKEAIFAKNDVYLYLGEKYRVRGKVRSFKIKPTDSDIVRVSSDELEKLRKNAKEIVVNRIEYVKLIKETMAEQNKK